MPETSNFSANFGRMPVGINSPSTSPLSRMPRLRKTKMSCMVTMSPSMPVISASEMTLRVPSLRRLTCTTTSMAEAICRRMRAFGNVQAAHGDHGFEAAQRVARRVGVNRGQRAVVAGVHGLQHVQRFLAAHLTDDDAVGTHTQRVDHQLALLDRAFAFDVGGPRFQAHDVVLVQLQFGRVFDRDDAFAVGNVGRKHVEERRLAGAGAAGDQNVQARFHAAAQKFQHRRSVSVLFWSKSSAVSGSRPKRRIERQGPSTASGGMMAFTREPSARRASTIGEDSSTRRPTAETMRSMMPIKMDVVAELDRGHLQNAFALDVDPLVRVDQNVRHGRIGKQRLERPESENFIENFLGEALPLLQVHRRGFADDQRFENLRHLAAHVLAVDFGQAVEIQLLNQLAVNRRLDGAEVGARDWCCDRGHELRHLFDGNEKNPPSEPFLVMGTTSRPANCAGDLPIAAAEHVVVILLQRRAQIDGGAGHPEIVGKAGEDRPVDVFLNALENFLVALVPAIDDDAGALRVDAEALQGQQAALERPQRRAHWPRPRSESCGPCAESQLHSEENCEPMSSRTMSKVF